jgi:carotenoid cleavage dioxygenase
MTKPFPAPLIEGMDEPCRFDIEVYDLEIVEVLCPPTLMACWCRLCLISFIRLKRDLYPMTIAAGGDGAVRAFRIKNGYIDFKSRYVRTERYCWSARRGVRNMAIIAILLMTPRLRQEPHHR